MYEIVKNKCTACESCIEMCPEGAIHLSDDKTHCFIDNNKCIECGICIDACEFNAFVEVNSDLTIKSININ